MKQFIDKVVYQIYPKSYLDTTGNGVGDIAGIIQKLDYLKNLGVDYIWLSPINKSPQKDNGYDISDYYHIDELFGTDDDYFLLIEEAKKRDLKIMMDLVLNHVSSDSEWFKEACLGNPKYYDYFIWRDEPNDIFNFFGPTSWTYVESVGKYYLHFFDPSQPDLNWENKAVREEIYTMVNYWIDKGIEGFRLDVIDIIGKEPDKFIMAKGPKFYEYLEELNQRTFGSNILTVGECWNSSIKEANKMCHEKGLSQIFHFQHLTLDHADDKFDYKELDYNQVIQSIKKWQNEYEGTPTQVLGNHDTPRLISNWFDDKNYHYQSATLACGLFHLLSGTSYIYQGDEIGMTNAYMPKISDYNDVETLNKYATLKAQGIPEEEIMQKIMFRGRDNSRIPMQWNDELNAGFSIGEPWLKVANNYELINVNKDLSCENSIYKFYQQLIKYKKANQSFINQPIDNITYDDGIIFYEKANIKVACNVTNQAIEYKVKGNIKLNNYSKYEGTLMPYQFILLEK